MGRYWNTYTSFSQPAVEVLRRTRHTAQRKQTDLRKLVGTGVVR